MRILACADLHGRSERIARVRALVAETAPAVVLLPGDLTHLEHGPEALTLFQTLSVPVLAIPGNMDSLHARAAIREQGRLLSEELVILDGVSFGGPNVTKPCHVLVTHEPPYGVLDALPSGKHIGSHQVLALLSQIRPRVLACGHVHESPGVKQVGATLVVNCTMGDGKTSGALIELTADSVQAHLV